MSEAIQMVCPHCDSINRSPAHRVGEAKCGRCKKKLFYNKPIDVRGQQLLRHLHKGDIPLLVDFWAPWCGPCRMMAPAFAQASHSLEPQVRLLKVNTEEESAVATQFGIRSIPTLILFQKGTERNRISGALDAHALETWTKNSLTST